MPAEPAYVPRMTPPALMTADELQHVYIPDKQIELVRGVLVVRELPGLRHARVAMDLALRLVARVYRDEGTEQILTADESLDGGDVVPGFSCPPNEVF